MNTNEFVNGGDAAMRNRPSLAQAFQEISTGARFVVDVNHLKSKGSACDLPDQGDGQGNCSAVRTNAANALSAWLASDPTGVEDEDVLILGDLNSYAKEDPIADALNCRVCQPDLNHFRGGRLFVCVQRAVGLPGPRPGKRGALQPR